MSEVPVNAALLLLFGLTACVLCMWVFIFSIRKGVNTSGDAKKNNNNKKNLSSTVDLFGSVF